MISSLSLLQPKEILVLVPELTVFLFPVGGLEDHGPHLPLGTKLIQAETNTRLLAEVLEKRLPNWNFILMPLLPLTVDSNTTSFSLNVRAHVVRDAIVDQCATLIIHKFSNFVTVATQVTPRQLSALEDAARIVSRKRWFGGASAQLASVTGALVEPKQVFESPMIALPVEHGGAYDTGFMLSQNEKWVDPIFKNLPQVPRPKAGAKRLIAYFKNEIAGYWGHPHLANAEGADKQQLEEVSQIAEKMIPWLEKGKGLSLFRSGYSYFPFNGSFFKAYVLATLFFLIMLMAALYSMKDSFDA